MKKIHIQAYTRQNCDRLILKYNLEKVYKFAWIRLVNFYLETLQKVSEVFLRFPLFS